jgi:hypothetical protein
MAFFTANVVPSSPILVTLMMEVIFCSNTSILTRATRHHIRGDGIPHYDGFLAGARTITDRFHFQPLDTASTNGKTYKTVDK